MSSFYVENFGCRATQADGAAIEQQFRENGLERAAGANRAGYAILNTCAVTAAAEKDARSAIRRIRAANPGCKIVVTGCYAQRAPAEVASLPGVSAVIGNSHKQNLAQIVLRKNSEKGGNRQGSFVPLTALTDDTSCLSTKNREEWGTRPGEGSVRVGPSAEVFVSDIFAHTELLAAPVFDSANERTRPNLKVQDGCNNRCSFCIIPSVRGQSRSLKLDEVLRQVKQLVDAGYREVVISGINLGRWGRDLSAESETKWGGRPCPPNLEQLVRTILDYTSIEKLRISSVEPMDWNDSLIKLMAESPRIAKHAHVPLQSGSDAVLRRMHRKYRPWHYREKIEKIRAAMAHAAIGADVMVGFPGETDCEFEETRRMIENLPFTYLHVFTFSARPGTPAASMPGQVSALVMRERNRILREIAARKKAAFMGSFVGKQIEAITLSVVNETRDGVWTEALTDNYLKLRLQGKLQSNRWLTARVVGAGAETLDGTVAMLLPQILASHPEEKQSHEYA